METTVLHEVGSSLALSSSPTCPEREERKREKERESNRKREREKKQEPWFSTTLHHGPLHGGDITRSL
jgi:hypothetical protein